MAGKGVKPKVLSSLQLSSIQRETLSWLLFQRDTVARMNDTEVLQTTQGRNGELQPAPQRQVCFFRVSQFLKISLLNVWTGTKGKAGLNPRQRLEFFRKLLDGSGATEQRKCKHHASKPYAKKSPMMCLLFQMRSTPSTLKTCRCTLGLMEMYKAYAYYVTRIPEYVEQYQLREGIVNYTYSQMCNLQQVFMPIWCHHPITFKIFFFSNSLNNRLTLKENDVCPASRRRFSMGEKVLLVNFIHSFLQDSQHEGGMEDRGPWVFVIPKENVVASETGCSGKFHGLLVCTSRQSRSVSGAHSFFVRCLLTWKAFGDRGPFWWKQELYIWGVCDWSFRSQHM